MIAITMSAYKDGSWEAVRGFTRPFSGSDKLDETLDSAITNLTLQPNDGSKEPFTKYKVKLNDGTTTQTRYFVVASPDGDKARMSD